MNFGAAATRWWLDRGQHREDSNDVARFLEWLQVRIGSGVAISKIDNNTISSLISERRSENVSHATVNRSCVEPLRAILRHAEFIGQEVGKIAWGKHKLKEPPGRVREMASDEEAKLFSALRPDFHPVARFLLLTGLRRAEACRLEWADVSLERGEMTVRGKGGTVDVRPLADAAIALLSLERGNHPERVFSYVVRHEWGGAKGSRVPIEPDTLATAFWRARKKAGVTDLRLHDFRHTAASRITRASGIAVTQKVLGHAKITTTQRYSHVNQEDIRAALNKAARAALNKAGSA